MRDQSISSSDSTQYLENDFTPEEIRDFKSFIKINPTNGCHEWTGGIDGKGYGYYELRGRREAAHRIAYVIANGRIPRGMPEGTNSLVVDHKCRNTICCKSDDLELVTQYVNVMRGTGFAAKNAAATHCSQGHEFTEENTRIVSGKRKCKICVSVRMKAHYQRNKERICTQIKENYAANKEEIEARKRQRREANPEQHLKKQREYAQKNRERIRAKNKRLYHLNKERINEERRANRHANREELNAKRRAAYQAKKSLVNP